MKKSLILVGLLSIGYAHAQEGRVGINAEDPKATLDIRPEASKLAGTSNEGIIAPKLTKTRIANIAVPVEGTLVYATDAVYVGSDVKVAKIDEKGYYYFDGTEWVKAKNVAQDQEWVYDDATKRINLRRSGDSTGTFKNRVYYNVETGQYIDTDSETEIPDTSYSDAFGYSNGNVSLSDLSEAKNISFSLSNNLKARTDKRSGAKFKGLNYYRMNITQEDVDTNHFRGNHYDLLVPAGNTNNYTSVYGDVSNSSLYGSGIVGTTIGQWGQVSIGNNQTVSGYATALLGSMGVRTSAKVGALYGIYGRNYFLGTDNGTVELAAAGYFENRHFNNNTLVKTYKGLRINTNSESNNMGTGISLIGIDNNVSHKGKTKYPNQYGIFTYSSVAATATAPDNHYGLYIHHIQGGLKTNYAIYTQTGQVRFGDLKGTGDRAVYVDADGVLKVGAAVSGLGTTSLWKREGAEVKLAVLSDGTDRTQENTVAINDKGEIYATSLKGKNGASIFPDYVFQKYYTGTSSIKADYTFKSLSQVEDYVKTNGHLPGYKSATDIKAQGYIDVMETQVANVEKIEELYLHTIEQEKKIEQLTRDILELKKLLINK